MCARAHTHTHTHINIQQNAGGLRPEILVESLEFNLELNEKQNKGEEHMFKTIKQQRHHLACIPDFKLLVALGVPRCSAFLAYFQPAGASGSLQGSTSKKKRHVDGDAK
jgi:hypothetical protein